MDCAPVGGPLNPPAVSRRATRTIMPVSPPSTKMATVPNTHNRATLCLCIAWRRDHPRSLRQPRPHPWHETGLWPRPLSLVR